MTTYFDIIPEELMSLILLKVENLQPVYDSKIATEILLGTNFWALKIHQGMPGVDMGFVKKLYILSNKRPVLSDYPDLLFDVRNSVYSSLITLYELVMHKVNRCSGAAFSISSINNFDIFLTLISNDLIKHALLNMVKEDHMRYRIFLDFRKDKTYTFTLSIDGVKMAPYSISRKEAIYLLMC